MSAWLLGVHLVLESITHPAMGQEGRVELIENERIGEFN